MIPYGVILWKTGYLNATVICCTGNTEELLAETISDSLHRDKTCQHGIMVVGTIVEVCNEGCLSSII